MWTLGQRSRLPGLPIAYFVAKKDFKNNIIYLVSFLYLIYTGWKGSSCCDFNTFRSVLPPGLRKTSNLKMVLLWLDSGI